MPWWISYFFSEDISFDLDQKPWFKKVMHLARNASKGYQPPNINLRSKDLLDIKYYQNMERKFSLIKRKSDIFGLLFLGDGATISITPLFKILVSGKNLPVAVLYLVNFHCHLSDYSKKY